MLDLGNTLIIYSLEVRHTLLNIYMDLMMVSIILELMGMLVPSKL